MRRKIIAANWKMNLDKNTARELLNDINKLEREGEEIIVFPPSVYLDMAGELLNDISFGAQNFYPEEKGAFTGEISVTQAKQYGIKYLLIGHSERRNIFNEDNELINKKIKSALEHGLIPVLCIGEPMKERENGTYEAYLYKELKEALCDINIDDIRNMIFAYEPIWAIGSGRALKASDIKIALEFIRNTLDVMYKGVKEDVHLLYGGSVNIENIDDIMSTEHVDGVLVGGASLKIDSFRRLVNYEVK
ncbi:MAG: triose-phosphate isomerase [Ezakiella sp.]|nr:triose-phosphate isomerase [Ezakiella sp.]MDD7761794.1 triose-phosphate isomerase [Bacillota bacterium]MDY3946609.1 triose-phosphate isomerase [Ezakiella sp.]